MNLDMKKLRGRQTLLEDQQLLHFPIDGATSTALRTLPHISSKIDGLRSAPFAAILQSDQRCGRRGGAVSFGTGGWGGGGLVRGLECLFGAHCFINSFNNL